MARFTSINFDITTLLHAPKTLHEIRPRDLWRFAEELAHGSIAVTATGHIYRPESLTAVMTFAESFGPFITWAPVEYQEAVSEIPWLADQRPCTSTPFLEIIDDAQGALVITGGATCRQMRVQDRPRAVCIAPWGVDEKDLSVIERRFTRGRKSV